MRTPPEDPRSQILSLLTARADDATVCPSEVVRALVGGQDGSEADWRCAMPEVHAAVDALVIEDLVGLSWKGERLAGRAGP